MAICPQGHTSAADELLRRLRRSLAAAAGTAHGVRRRGRARGGGRGRVRTPVRALPGRARAGQFCEASRPTTATPTHRAPDRRRPGRVPAARWAGGPPRPADRAYYEEVIATRAARIADAVRLPAVLPRRSFALVRASRYASAGAAWHAASAGDRPDRAARGPGRLPPARVLLAEPDGSWTLVDPGSANGTQVNGSARLAVNVEVPLGDGDRIHLGAGPSSRSAEARHDVDGPSRRSPVPRRPPGGPGRRAAPDPPVPGTDPAPSPASPSAPWRCSSSSLVAPRTVRRARRAAGDRPRRGPAGGRHRRPVLRAQRHGRPARRRAADGRSTRRPSGGPPCARVRAAALRGEPRAAAGLELAGDDPAEQRTVAVGARRLGRYERLAGQALLLDEQASHAAGPPPAAGGRAVPPGDRPDEAGRCCPRRTT